MADPEQPSEDGRPVGAPVDLDEPNNPADEAVTSEDLDSVVYRGDGPTVQDAPYDPTQDREEKRGQIAMTLVRALLGVVIASFLLFGVKVFFNDCGACDPEDQNSIASYVNALSEIIELIYAPLVGLIGAVTGFYFGERSS